MSSQNTAAADGLDLFRQDFEHEDQVRMCARHLELMRTDMDAEWGTWAQVKPGKGLKSLISPTRTGWTPERVGMAGHFVRHASESSNHEATVDFITHKTLDIIKGSRALYPRRKKASYHLNQWKLFAHEHMVPGAAALRLLTDPDFPRNQGPLYELLSALSFRALVTRTKGKRADATAENEVGMVDKKYASRLPKPCEISGWPGPNDLYKIDPRYYGLMRYDAAGLLDELIAVSPRAVKALADYQAYKAGLAAADASPAPERHAA
jgi:hypothetical protein